MFDLLKRKPKRKKLPQLQDLNGVPLQDGDQVTALRYDLKKSTLTLEEEHYYYVSEDGEKKVSFTRMIDAITGNQKVIKIDS
jgi:ribosomal protein L15E